MNALSERDALLRRFYSRYKNWRARQKSSMFIRRRRGSGIPIMPRDNYSNNPWYRTNRAYAAVGFIIEGFAGRVKNIRMSEEKQDKERKVTDRVAPARRGDNAENKVAADNIRKEANFLEGLSRRSWPKKYEHLTGRFFNEVLAEECREAGLPVDTFARDPPEDAVVHSPIPLRSSPPAPKTTSARIGHRSSRQEYSLEFMGRLYVSPKSTMEPPVADNVELPRMTQQRFIFLG